MSVRRQRRSHLLFVILPEKKGKVSLNFFKICFYAIVDELYGDVVVIKRFPAGLISRTY